MRAKRLGAALCFEQFETRRLLAADLAITDVYLRDYLGNRVDSGPIGEQIEVVAEWTTTELPASAAYDVYFKVNGYELTVPGISQGAGRLSFSASLAQLGWYAVGGDNSIEVRLDSGSTIAEGNESNNLLVRSFVSVAQNPPTVFGWPLAGKLFEDFGVGNYYDVDPSSVSVDYLGRTVYTNSHLGWDIVSGGFDKVDLGLAVVASSSGTVSFVDDGYFDREVEPTAGLPAGVVIVEHGSGWQTVYAHFRRDSIAVNEGDSVQAEQYLGLVGSSGQSGGPHLHFDIRRNNRGVDPMIARSVLDSSVEDRLAQTDIAHLRITNRETVDDYGETISHTRVFENISQTIFMGFNVFGQRKGDDIHVQVFQPGDSAEWFSFDITASDDVSWGAWLPRWQIGSSSVSGVYRVIYSHDGVILGEDFFEIGSSVLPELSIRNEGVAVTEARWTPFDFAPTAKNAASPKLTFTIENHGTAPMAIEGIELPEWVELSKAPASVLGAGQSDTFEIAASTVEAGIRWGQVAVLTDDKSERRSTFQVESLITDTALGSTRVGLSVQHATEGQKVLAKVYRSFVNNQPLVVDLSSSNSMVLKLPSSVTIAANDSWALFEVQVVDNNTTEQLQRIEIRATPRGNYLASHSELLIIDDETSSGAVSLSFANSSISENGGEVSGTLTRSGDLRDELTVNLFVKDDTELRTPLFVTIPAFKDSADFRLTGIDDELVDGSQTVEIVASVFGVASAKRSILVLDNERAELFISVNPISISEGGPAATGTVSRNTESSVALTVQLTSSDTSEATVPGQVTIPAGQTFVSFAVRGVSDGIVDGNQSATIQVSAQTFQPSSAELQVLDVDLPTLVITTHPSAISEANGKATLTVSRNTNTDAELTVSISVSVEGWLSVPSTVLLPAGASQAVFEASAVDNLFADGDQLVEILASSSSFESSTADLSIIDDELAALTLAGAHNQVSENGGVVDFTVSRNTRPDHELEVFVTTSNARLSATGKLTIPVGETTATFSATGIDDSLALGDLTVQVSVSATSLANSNFEVLLIDDDSPKLDLRLNADVITENSGTAELSIQRNAFLDQSLEIQLLSSVTGRIDSPLTIILAAGQASIIVELRAVDNSMPGDDAVITFTASANSFGTVGIDLTVTNDDPWTWTNSRNSLDTNDDGFVSPIDALIVINYINSFGGGSLAPPPNKPDSFIDVNFDNSVSPIDALLVINFLNAQSAGEGESVFQYHGVQEEPSATLSQHEYNLMGFQFLLLSDRFKRDSSRDGKEFLILV